MDRRGFLLEMRKAHQLKGLKPCYVMINLRLDKPYHGEYIMSIREDKLYFQKINRLFGMLRPDSDFEITIGVSSSFLSGITISWLFAKAFKTFFIDVSLYVISIKFFETMILWIIALISFGSE